MPARPILVEAAEYRGQGDVAVAATQLGLEYSEARKRKVVDEWVAFFSAGPTPLRRLYLASRTPKRLFESLAGQTQLERLAVKWGDYDDLSALAGLTRLEHLSLGGATAVHDLTPLAALTGLERLNIESIKRVQDLSPLTALTSVTHLEVGGDWISPRRAHVDSIGFLRRMPQLKELVLHTIIVDDLDYTPLLDLPALRGVRVMKARGMRPTYDELKERLPWNGA